MTATTLNPVFRGRRLVVTLALAALTIGIVAAQIAIHAGSSKPVPTISNPGYARSISALSPERLRAAFGTDQVAPAPTVTGESGYARKIAALPSRTLAAAFGGAAPAVRSSRSDFAKRVARLSPHRRAAAFGVRR